MSKFPFPPKTFAALAILRSFLPTLIRAELVRASGTRRRLSLICDLPERALRIGGPTRKTISPLTPAELLPTVLSMVQWLQQQMPERDTTLSVEMHQAIADFAASPTAKHLPFRAKNPQHRATSPATELSKALPQGFRASLRKRQNRKNRLMIEASVPLYHPQRSQHRRFTAIVKRPTELHEVVTRLQQRLAQLNPPVQRAWTDESRREFAAITTGLKLLKLPWVK
ncbi:MAG: hypothetical protein II007_00025 [Gammaproteobacteria bacterium]|nr:hypothetical protein [Gammaproteobacteria bacterium]